MGGAAHQGPKCGARSAPGETAPPWRHPQLPSSTAPRVPASSVRLPGMHVRQACTSLEQEAWGLREAHTECATGPQLLTQNRVLLIRRSEVNETGQDTAARASSLSPAGPMRQPGAHLLFQTQALLW